MSEKLITFVVPSYNSQDYLHICVDSLLKGGSQVEILIVNDGSKDRTGEIADEYAAKYPDIVRVLHQENGGHGEGINHGLREATGTYFKVVDSDDWVDEESYKKVLKRLRSCEKRGGVDMMVCNYKYVHREEPEKDRVISYGNALPKNRILAWKDTHAFFPWQYLTLHSCLFRTEVLRESGIELPKHVFFEDNLYVTYPMPYVKRLTYLPVNFYQYLIGRADQSVAEESLKKKCTHQILVAERIFACHDLKEVWKQDKRLAMYLFHEIWFMTMLAVTFTRMNRTDEAEQLLTEMWTDMACHDVTLERIVRFCTPCALMSLPGKVGREIGLWGYRVAHKIVPFN